MSTYYPVSTEHGYTPEYVEVYNELDRLLCALYSAGVSSDDVYKDKTVREMCAILDSQPGRQVAAFGHLKLVRSYNFAWQ